MTQKEYVDRLRREMRSYKKASFSDEYIERCCSYAINLLEQDLPALFNGQHVESVLLLKRIRQGCYHEFYIPKSNGRRTILAPSRSLKARQQWIYKNILSKQWVSDYAQGFIARRSIVSNARLHIGYQYTLCVDIADFFPSIKSEQVKKIFNEMGYSGSAADKLTELCTYSGVLPQGAPTSPCLSNLVCRKLDGELADLARQFDCVFSRYADDITFSANHEVLQILSPVQEALQKHQFHLNVDKCRVYGPAQPKHITGLVVQNEVHVPKTFKRKLKQEIYYCKKFGVSAHLENTDVTKWVHYKEHLYGKAYFVKMVEPEIGRFFLKELSDIAWPT